MVLAGVVAITMEAGRIFSRVLAKTDQPAWEKDESWKDEFELD